MITSKNIIRIYNFVPLKAWPLWTGKDTVLTASGHEARVGDDVRLTSALEANMGIEALLTKQDSQPVIIEPVRALYTDFLVVTAARVSSESDFGYVIKPEMLAELRAIFDPLLSDPTVFGTGLVEILATGISYRLLYRHKEKAMHLAGAFPDAFIK